MKDSTLLYEMKLHTIKEQLGELGLLHLEKKRFDGEPYHFLPLPGGCNKVIVHFFSR